MYKEKTGVKLPITCPDYTAIIAGIRQRKAEAAVADGKTQQTHVQPKRPEDLKVMMAPPHFNGVAEVGWMAPAYRDGNNNGGSMTPPPQPQYTGQTFNSNEGSYGGHNDGIASPQNT